MIRNVTFDTAPTPADDSIRSIEDRPLSFGAALVGFVLSTALTSTVLVLLSQ